MYNSYQFNLRDILTILFKHKKKILSIFFSISFAGTLISFLIAPTYESESTLMVKMGREHIYRPEVGTVNPPLSFDQERIIKSEIQILSSQDLARRVVERLGVMKLYPDFLDNPPPTMNPQLASARELQKKLETSVVPDSNVIKVSFQHHDPIISAKVVNLLTDFLLEKHLEIFSNPQGPFLKKQAVAYQEQLNQSKTKLQEFKQQHGLSSLEDEQRLLLEQRIALDTSLKEIQNQRRGLISKLTALKAQVSQVSEHIALNSVSQQQKVIDEAKANLLTLRLEEQKLSTRYKDTSRFIRNIQDEIAMVQRFIQEQEADLTDRVTTGKNPVFQELEIEIHKSKSELGSLEIQARETKQQLQELATKLRNLDQLEKEMETLQLQANSDEENYTMYLAKVEEARISEEMDQLKMANISVIQPATTPSKPIKPRKALNIILSVMMGLITALLATVASEYLQGGYTRPEYVMKDLELPILTSVSYKS